MASIYLIRHGQASFGKANYDELSDLGQVQAAHLGKALCDRLPKFDHVTLGGMQRHRQTAENCLAAFEMSLEEASAQIDDRWNEYDHQAILAAYRPEYATPSEMTQFIRQQENPKSFFEQEFNAAMNRWISGQHDNDYAESWQSFNRRVHAACDDLIERRGSAKHLAVFTSGGPISLLSQALLGVEREKIMQMNWTLMNCGVTKIVTTGTRRFIASLNEHTHFEAPQNKHLISYT